MSFEDSREIERIFNQDVREKKIIGYGVHKRTGVGKRGGVKGGVRFAKNNFGRYEKNSKVRTERIFENVMNYKEFLTYNKEQQISLLFEWRKRFSNERIRKQLGISVARYNKLITELEIERLEGVDSLLTLEEMEIAKEKVIPYHEFRRLPSYQKFELVDHYMKSLNMRIKDIVKAWDNVISHGTLSSQKSQWKKDYDKKQAEEVDQMNDANNNDDLNYLLNPSMNVNKKDETDENERPDVKAETVEPQTDESNDTQTTEILDYNQDDELFNVTISGEFSGYGLKEKILSIYNLIDGADEYIVSISVKESHNDSN